MVSHAGWTSGWLYNRYPEHPKSLLLGGMGLGVLAALFYAVRLDSKLHCVLIPYSEDISSCVANPGPGADLRNSC